MTFTPNWQRLGFKSIEEGWKHVLGFLAKNRKKVTSKGLTNEALFTLGSQMFAIKGKKKKES